jgi:TPR repeat protein
MWTLGGWGDMQRTGARGFSVVHLIVRTNRLKTITKTSTLLAVLFTAVLAGCANNPASGRSDIKRAEQASFRGDARAAIIILQPLADRGDAEAQYALAKVHLGGRSADRNPADGKRWLLKAAEQGHVSAQLDIANYAIEEKNYADALKWYLKVVEQHPNDASGRTAAEHLGVMYWNGEGVQQDFAEAARWNQRSAELGGAKGQFALGLIYLDGLAGTKDFEKAAKWFGAAARQGYAPARYMLVFIYADGIVTKPDAIEAAYWTSGRRISNEGEAAYYLGTFFSRGFFVYEQELRVLAWRLRKQDVPPAKAREYLNQVAKYANWGDEDEAVRWYKTGAEAGFVGAQVNLAGIQWNQASRHWNCGEAAKWTRIAAEKADPTGMVNLGLFYLNGPKDRVINAIGVQLKESDRGIAIEAVTQASPAEEAGVQPADLIVEFNGQDARKLGAKGVGDAIRATKDKAVALSLRRDDKSWSISITPREVRFKCPGADTTGLQKDSEEAVKWFEKAADRGNLTGLFFLAEAYRKGTGVPLDYKKALELYEKGADRGDWEAAQAISHMYSNGEAGEKNKDLADRWFRKAVDLKHKAVRG